MMLARRGLLGALLTAPAIIRTPGLLMAVKAAPQVWIYHTHGMSFVITRELLYGMIPCPLPPMATQKLIDEIAAYQARLAHELKRQMFYEGTVA